MFQPSASAPLPGDAPTSQASAEAELSVGEAQELAEQVGTLQRIALAAGATLHLRVQITLDGGQPLTPQQRADFAAALRAISPRLLAPEAPQRRL